jgi:hypothetical protein
MTLAFDIITNPFRTTFAAYFYYLYCPDSPAVEARIGFGTSSLPVCGGAG